jgi:SAM-dependent methyltransferase
MVWDLRITFIFRCHGLLEFSSQRGFDSVLGTVLSVPLRDASVDFALSIAVLHHLRTRERRLEALREMQRVLKPSGRALVFVWSLEENRSVRRHDLTLLDDNEQDVLVPWMLMLSLVAEEPDKGLSTALKEPIEVAMLIELSNDALNVWNHRLTLEDPVLVLTDVDNKAAGPVRGMRRINVDEVEARLVVGKRLQEEAKVSLEIDELGTSAFRFSLAFSLKVRKDPAFMGNVRLQLVALALELLKPGRKRLALLP